MESILLLEPNPAFARIIGTKLLNHTGCHVVTAHTFAEASRLVEMAGTSFVIAVCDSAPPDAPDAAAVQWLLERKIPVISLSSQYDEGLRNRFAGLPLVDALLKRTTEDLNVLANTVQRVLDNRGQKILLVDDAVPYRVAMREMLESQLYTVIEAGDGKEGLEQLAKHPDCRLVVTDYYMPVMDGFEFVTTVRRTRSREQLAIIVLSGAQKEDVAAQFLKFGANDFIKKPFSAEEFNWRINLNAEYLEMVQQLQRLANTDAMTGLLNRRSFYDQARRLFSGPEKRCAVAMLDIDHFKKVNDTYGHDAGDTAIKSLASWLREHMPEHAVVARFGGEEYCVLLTGEEPAAVHDRFERLRAAAEAATVKHGTVSFGFTVSIGVCARRMSSLDEAITRADTLLYEAKRGGRNRVRFD